MATYVYDAVNDKLNLVAGATLYADVGVGFIGAFDAEEVPDGWLIFNGQTVLRSDYPDLWARANRNGQVGVGKFYGIGDGSTTFTLVDLRGKFLEGIGSGITGKAVGDDVAAGLPNITGGADVSLQDNVWTGGGDSPSNSATYHGTAASGTTYGTVTGGNGIMKPLLFNASRSNSIYGNSDTVQPPSKLVVWAVKARMTGLPIDLKQQVENYIVERSIPVSHPITPATGITARDFSGYIKSGNVITVILGQLVPSSNLAPFAPLLKELPNPPQVTPFMTSIGYCFIDADGNVKTGRDTSVSAGATIDGTFTYTV